MSEEEAGSTCLWERQAELVRGRGRQNMSEGGASRSCLWKRQADMSYRFRQDMSVGKVCRTCQCEIQLEHVNGRCRQNMPVGEAGKQPVGGDRQNMSVGDHVSGGGMQDMSE
jgi:hypothetical protein